MSGSLLLATAKEESINSALVQGTREENVTDLVDIVVLGHQGLVGLELNKAKLVESLEAGGELSRLKLICLVHVDLLWSLDVLLHGDDAGGKVFDLVVSLLLGWLCSSLGDWLLLANDENIAPGLVAKLDVSSLESEEGLVLAWELWGLEGDGEGPLSVWLDLAPDLVDGALHVVTTGLAEEHISWPGNLTSVSEGPGLGELLTRLDLVLFRDGLLDKSGHELLALWHLFLLGLLLLLLWLGCWLSGCLWQIDLASGNIGKGVKEVLASQERGWVEARGLSRLSVLADDLVWGLLWMSDLEEGVVAVLALGLALLAQVEVSCDCALVSDATEWADTTAIASDVLMDDLGLGSSLVLDVLTEHLGEDRPPHVLDLVDHLVEGQELIVVLVLHGGSWSLASLALELVGGGASVDHLRDGGPLGPEAISDLLVLQVDEAVIGTGEEVGVQLQSSLGLLEAGLAC